MKLSNNYFALYRFFNSHTVIIARFVLLAIFIFLLIISESIKMREVLSGFIILFFVNEIFIRFRLSRILPEKIVDKNDQDLENSILFPARVNFTNGHDGYDVAKRIFSTPEGKFFAEKLGIIIESLPNIDIAKVEMLKKASEIVVNTPCKYISNADLLAAYILISENKTLLLAHHGISESDIKNIVYWTRHTFLVDNPASSDLVFRGIGFGESFVYGWHYEIKKYCTDLTADVISKKYPPIVVGRGDEYERLITALSKKSGNNILLVGETGTGKSAMVEYFAYNSHIGTVPDVLAHKKVYYVHVDRILSGIQNQGQLAERLDQLFSDLEHSGNALLYIPVIENMFGGGGFTFDVSGVLYDYIKNDKISIIGSTTPSGFKTYLENKSTIVSLFDRIMLEEPKSDDALFMIFEKVALLQEKYQTHYTYQAVKKAVELSASYLPDFYLPGKAITLLEDVASGMKLSKKPLITEKEIIAHIEEKTNVLLATPNDKEKNLLLNLEKVLREKIVDQDEAVTTIADALRRVRSGFKSGPRPIAAFLFLGPTGVGKTESARALSQLYFQDDKRLIRLDMSEYQTQDSIKRLLGSLPGEEVSTSPFLDTLRQHPFSLILLDEFEKAYPKILDVFLQVFEEGVLTDNLGRKVSFSNTIIIATSNAGSELVREKMSAGAKVSDFKPEVIEYLQREHIIKPELLNRFDDVVMFKPLSKQAIEKIADLLLKESFESLTKQQIKISYDKSVIEKIIAESYSYEFGARNVRRYIQSDIESFFSKLILEGKLEIGSEKILSVDNQNQFVLR